MSAAKKSGPKTEVLDEEPVEAVDESAELPVEPAEAAEIPDLPEAEADPAAVVAPGGVRKAPGVKEVPPFKWKIVGHREGVALTLFKSVEREDSDAQLERLGREGYYTHLRVMDVHAKVEHPSPQKAAKKPEPASKAFSNARAAESAAKEKKAAAGAKATAKKSPPKDEKRIGQVKASAAKVASSKSTAATKKKAAPAAKKTAAKKAPPAKKKSR